MEIYRIIGIHKKTGESTELFHAIPARQLAKGIETANNLGYTISKVFHCGDIKTGYRVTDVTIKFKKDWGLA